MRNLFLFFLAFFSLGAVAQQAKEPTVILISLDGFRYDYVEQYQPENLTRFIESGVRSKALIPSFPTKTFPNHYTIATGMRPEHHGIVDNSFYDSQKDETYRINNRKAVVDGTWYGGTPLWVLAEQHGIKAASYFFVGSEADVQGVRPSYYYDYDGRVNNLKRVSKVFEWLQMPDSIRPRMITMYFSDMDDTGHRYGPGNEAELSKTLEKVDRELGALFEGIKSLDQEVNVIIVSDHGMADMRLEKYISLDQVTKGIQARVVNSGALAHLYLEPGQDKSAALKLLQSREKGFKAFDPAEGNYYGDVSSHADRIGDLIVLAELDYYFMENEAYREVIDRRMRMDDTAVRGTHGYSELYPEMHGIFYAHGPQFKSGLTIEAFDNVHIYPLICEILGLPVPEGIDGDLTVLKPILKE